MTRILEEHKRFVAELEINFARSKSSMVDDYEKQLQSLTLLYERKLIELGQLKEQEKEKQRSDLQ